jgi:uncharacterized Zn finger protein
MSARKLSEYDIRQRATTNSFERGEDYYHSGMVEAFAHVGDTLTATVAGSQAALYRVEVQLVDDTIRSATCSCPYDYEGDCKHIVAVLLAYIHQGTAPPGTTDDLLDTMTADQLRNLIRTLREQKPELEDWFQVMLPGMALSAPAEPSTKTVRRVDTSAFRRQVTRAIGRIDYGNHWQSIWDAVNGLDEAQAQTRSFLQRGDFNNALELMRILGEEVAPDYGELEEESQLADFLQGWSADLTEAILGADLTADERGNLSQQLDTWAAELSEYGLDEIMDGPITACTRGWEAPADRSAFAFDLSEAKLNVQAYRGDDETYLSACLKAGAHDRYAQRLIELGRVDEAVTHISQHPLRSSDDSVFRNPYLTVAESLQKHGHNEAALKVGVMGISEPGHKYPLGEWLAHLAEQLDRMDIAQQAWRAAFDSMPSVESYRNLKRLSGERWPELRSQLIAQAEAQDKDTVLIEIALEDNDINRAIDIWDRYPYGGYQLLDELVEAAAASHPDWAGQQALAEAQKLIHRGSKYYPHAVRWLGKVKRIYLQHNRPGDWQRCMDTIKMEHGRKYSLMRQIDGL